MQRLVIAILALGLSAHAVSYSLPCSAPCLYGPQVVTHNGITRYYAAYFPANISASTAYPLMVVLNGANIVAYNSPKLDNQQVLQTFADANGVAVLWVLSGVYDTGPLPGVASQPYINCTNSSDACQWVWRLPFYFTSYYTNYDDFGYLTQQIANAETAWGADPTRVLLIGGSTGGLEAHAYAQANPANVLAIGTFAGPIWAQNGFETPGQPTGNVNVFMAHGDEDATLPYCGGPTDEPWYGLNGIASASADDTFNYWTGSTVMNCTTFTPSANLCPAIGGVLQKVATGCSGGKRAMFMRVPGGTHLSVANYSYALLTDFWNFVFPPAGNSTTTSVVSSLNPSTMGEGITLQVTVSSSFGTPTGRVAFTRNGVPIGTVTLSGGQALLNWTFATVGTKSIVAYYSGNGNFASSVSTQLIQQVNQGTTTTSLVSSSNPANTGQLVNLTATVAPQNGGTATGTVTFMNGSTVIGAAVPLTNGQAAITKTFLVSGSKSLSAVYSGDVNNQPSTGTTTQTVN